MKKKTERKFRVSLALLFSGIVLVILLVTTAIVAGIIILLVYNRILKFGEVGFNAGSFMLLLIGLSLGVGITLSFSTSRLSLTPINKIVNAMNRLAAGDYTARLSFKGPLGKHPTVSEFTGSFNKMASELERNKVIHKDFINNFSHEFKTPIVSVAGFARLLKRDNLSKEKRNEYLQVIEEESLRLSQMATNVLNLTKIENQQSLSDVGVFNLTEQIRTCILMLESKWEKKNIEFSLFNDEYDIRASEELLKQVWINLLDNAVKFSPQDGLITVAIDKEPSDVKVTFTNSGDTIPAESIDRIFDSFYQADESHSTEGNGIGLTVVKRIVELHNGSVGVKSENGVNTFTVIIPQ
ncbi:MAG: HAMP domain-containing histidine kinase [Clostridia bacterium]|nr:HAMP domain-containing histidine kinase [Clostridia bacterium]